MLYEIYKKYIKEDGVPVNVAGSGNIAGIGVNNPNLPNQAEPGKNNRKKKPLYSILKRKENKNGR